MHNLEERAREIRRLIVIATSKAGASHVGSALSCVDILTTLYFNTMKINPKNPRWKIRDILILSKGHGGIALLTTLAVRGYFSVRKLADYCKNGSTLTGHTMIESAPGVEATTGSLGHGLPIGLGIALSNKSKVFVVVSDGELDEGSNWEAILAAGNFKVDNLVVIVDYNKIQSFGFTKDVMDLEPFAQKWKSFQWAVREVDGHDFDNLSTVFALTPFEKGKPTVIIAHTIKGKGVSYMENKLEWHYKSASESELMQAMEELK